MREMFLRLIKNKLFWLTFTSLVLGGFLGWGLFWESSFKELQEQIAARKTEKDKSAVVKRIVQAEKKLSAHQDVFSKTEDASWLFATISKTAEESGVSLSSITPDFATTDFPAYKRINLRIITRCTYHELGRFISRIESNPVFIKVQSVQLSPTPEANESGVRLNVNLSVSAYFFQKSVSP